MSAAAITAIFCCSGAWLEPEPEAVSPSWIEPAGMATFCCFWVSLTWLGPLKSAGHGCNNQPGHLLQLPQVRFWRNQQAMGETAMRAIFWYSGGCLEPEPGPGSSWACVPPVITASNAP